MTSESPRRVRLITRREQIDSRRVEETRTSWNDTGTPASVINAFMKIDGLVDCLWADKEISPGHVLRPFIQHVSLRRKRISGNHYLFIETLLSFSTRYLIFFIYCFFFYCKDIIYPNYGRINRKERCQLYPIELNKLWIFMQIRIIDFYMYLNFL